MRAPPRRLTATGGPHEFGSAPIVFLVVGCMVHFLLSGAVFVATCRWPSQWRPHLHSALFEPRGALAEAWRWVRAGRSCVSRLGLSALREGVETQRRAALERASAARRRGSDSGAPSARHRSSLAHVVRLAPVSAGVGTQEGCYRYRHTERLRERGLVSPLMGFSDRFDSGDDHARTQAGVRVLRRRPSTRFQQRLHLHLRVHVLRFLRRIEARLHMPQLRW
jgi:hypothetical protein